MKKENRTIQQQYENLVNSLKHAYDKIPLSDLDLKSNSKKITHHSSLIT